MIIVIPMFLHAQLRWMLLDNQTFCSCLIFLLTGRSNSFSAGAFLPSAHPVSHSTTLCVLATRDVLLSLLFLAVTPATVAK